MPYITISDIRSHRESSSIAPTSGIELLGDAPDGLWIEYMSSVNEEYPVLIGLEGTELSATITEIEIIEDNSLSR